MKDFREKLVLVTGAGNGIGRATALAFARAGARLALVDVNGKGAAKTQAMVEKLGSTASRHTADVSNAEAMRKLAARVHRELGVVDVLVNNAGIGSAGRFLDTSLETWRKVMDINLMGVVHGCHAFLPAMVERGEGGHVVNLSSMAGYFAAPDMPVYAASKFAVLGFSESLRGDMAEHGIGVTAICPGLINTGIISSTIMEGDMSAGGVREKVQNLYSKRNYTPEQVAEAIIEAVRKNQAVRPVSPESWAVYYAKRIAPGLVARLARTKNPFV